MYLKNTTQIRQNRGPNILKTSAPDTSIPRYQYTQIPVYPDTSIPRYQYTQIPSDQTLVRCTQLTSPGRGTFQPSSTQLLKFHTLRKLLYASAESSTFLKIMVQYCTVAQVTRIARFNESVPLIWRVWVLAWIWIWRGYGYGGD